MSDLLRDDVQETATVREKWLWGSHAISEDRGRGRDVAFFGLGVVVADVGRGRGDVVSGDLFALVDTARGRDDVFHQSVSGCLVDDVAKVRERYFLPQFALAHDVGRGFASVIDGGAADNGLWHDRVRANETWLLARVFDDVAQDTVRVRDDVFFGCLNVVDDTARMGDVAFSGSLKYEKVHDGAKGVASAFYAVENCQVAVSQARVRDDVFGKAEQGAWWHDRVAVLDWALSDDERLGAMIWTANVDSLAMSQYLPTDVVGLAVVDGVLWGLGRQGVYALDGDDELISGSLKMGLIDTSGGGLLHPVGSYVEYERDNGAVVDLAVTMPQSGREQRFVYRLARERANSLTNGRFVFGRGLRGRHFGFELMIKGKWAFVNDWTVDLTPTKRRV